MTLSLIHLYKINMNGQHQTTNQKLDRVKILKLEFELKLKKILLQYDIFINTSL